MCGHVITKNMYALLCNTCIHTPRQYAVLHNISYRDIILKSTHTQPALGILLADNVDYGRVGDDDAKTAMPKSVQKRRKN